MLDISEYTKTYTEPFGETNHDGKNNMILSKDIFLSLDYDGIGENNNHLSQNANVLVLGGAGSSKTFGLTGPNIMQANSSYIITDAAGMLYERHGYFLENQGYTVKCLNLDRLEQSNHYNPFKYIHSDNDISVLADIIINMGNRGRGSMDSLWTNTEKILMEALIGYVHEYIPQEKQNFSEVVKLLRSGTGMEDTLSNLNDIFQKAKETKPNTYSLEKYDGFDKYAPEMTKRSILTSVSVYLQMFYLNDVKALTDTDDMDLDKVGDEKTAIFIIIPTGELTFNTLAAMLYTQFLRCTYDHCEKTAIYSQVVYDGNGEVVKTFRAENEDKSQNDALARATAFLEKAKTATIVKEGDTWRIIDAEGNIIGFRRTEEDANKALEAIRKGIIRRQVRRRLSTHVQLIMDEFQAIPCEIPGLTEMVATCRKYNVSFMFMLQSLRQMKSLYPDKWELLVGNCDTIVYLGGGADLDTIEWVSKKTGYDKETKNKKDNFSPEQLRGIKETDCVVILKSTGIYIGRKYNTMDHPNWRWCDGTHPYLFSPAKA